MHHGVQRAEARAGGSGRRGGLRFIGDIRCVIVSVTAGCPDLLYQRLACSPGRRASDQQQPSPIARRQMPRDMPADSSKRPGEQHRRA